MNTIAKEFSKNAKIFFPIYGAKEKEYLKNLESNIEDFCEDNNIDSLDDLYSKYGTPSDVAHSYFSACSSEYILNKLKIAKTIKYSLALIITAVFIALSSYCIKLYAEYQIFAEEQIFYEETFIE